MIILYYREEFREITNFIEVKFQDPFRGQKKDYHCFNGEYALRVRKFLLESTRKRIFKLIDGFLLFMYCVDIVMDLAYPDHHFLKVGLQVFTWLFLAITVSKYVGLGSKKFLEDKYNILDSIALPIAGIGYITGINLLQSLTFLRYVDMIYLMIRLICLGGLLQIITSD